MVGEGQRWAHLSHGHRPLYENNGHFLFTHGDSRDLIILFWWWTRFQVHILSLFSYLLALKRQNFYCYTWLIMIASSHIATVYFGQSARFRRNWFMNEWRNSMISQVPCCDRLEGEEKKKERGFKCSSIQRDKLASTTTPSARISSLIWFIPVRAP